MSGKWAVRPMSFWSKTFVFLASDTDVAIPAARNAKKSFKLVQNYTRDKIRASK